MAIGVEVSHDDAVVIMEVKKKVKLSCENRGTTGYVGM